MKPIILIIDDDSIFRTLTEKRFENDGWEVIGAGTAEEGIKKAKERSPDVALVDVRLPDRLGVEIVPALKRARPHLPVVMVSISGEPQYVVSAIKNGASDYVTKPVDFPSLFQKVRDLLEVQRVKKTESHLRGLEGAPFVWGTGVITRQLIRDISRASNTETTLLLRGETGVGKNLIARVIHDLSPRAKEKFQSVGCAAVPEPALEAELFGSEKAAKENPGKFESANRGTIYLDEVGDLPPEIQAKLLRVLQGGEFERVGGTKTVHVDVRVIASSSRNLEKAIAEGRFREDLFYRLNVVSLSVPPLRERREDIGLLAENFVKNAAKKSGKTFGKLSGAILEKLRSYPWPGNIRELQNVTERAVVMSQEAELRPEDFVLAETTGKAVSTLRGDGGELDFNSLKELEERTLLDAIRRSSGNVAKAARLLGISRGTVYRRLRKYDIGLKSQEV